MECDPVVGGDGCLGIKGTARNLEIVQWWKAAGIRRIAKASSAVGL